MIQTWIMHYDIEAITIFPADYQTFSDLFTYEK